MGLLSPWFLVGLLGVAIPVYVHLLRKHVAPPRVVSSLMFFERGTQSSTRHRRLRYLLLFSLRTLLVLLIVLAFANPFLRRASAARDTLLLVVVDNSFSMHTGSRFAEAKHQAMNLIALKPHSQRGQVVALGGQIQILTQPTSDATQLRSAVEAIELGDGHATFSELARFVHTLDETWDGAIDLHLFSDMQRTAMPENFSDAVMPSSVRLHPHAVDTGGTTLSNWTIDSVTAPAELTNSKDPSNSTVKAIVSGFSNKGSEKTVSLLINGKVTSTKTIHIAASGRTPVEFVPVDIGYGFNRCEVRVEGDDALPADDSYRFVIRRTDPQRVLFIHNPSDQRSPVYFDAALKAATHGSFVLQPVSSDQSTQQNPDRFTFVVLSDVTMLPPQFERSLAQYVSKGGSVFISLGLEAEKHQHVPLWPGDSQPARTLTPSNPISVGQVDFTYPALEQGKPGADNGGWSDIQVLYANSVEPSGARIAARLSDGTPLLLEKTVGEGRVLLFTTGFDNLTNDLPLHPVFVSFIDKTARYLSGEGEISGSRRVDSYLQLQTSTAAIPLKTGAAIIDPEGHRPLSLEEARTTPTFRLARAGFYQVHYPGGRDAVIAVNPDPRESDLTPIPPEMMSLWVGSNDARRIEPSSTSGTSYQDRTLWWYVMLSAFVVAVAEALLSNRYLGIQREEI